MSESRQRAESDGDTRNLSITAEKSEIIDIPFPTLEGMFKKAADTTNDESLMWKIPAPKETNSIPLAQTTFLVHSKSSRDPHKVTVSKNGKVQCDKACVNWCTYSLCSHSLAVAEKNGLLKAFLALFKSSKRSPNVTRLVNVNMPNNAGQKSGTRKRKGAANKSPQHGKTVIFSRILQPAQSLVGQPSPLQTRICQPSSSQSVANVNCFSSSYSDLTQLHQYAPIPRPRQPASFQSTVG